MEHEFWHERWQRSEIGFHQAEFNRHLQDFWSTLKVSPGAEVFVPLCGKSRDLLWLRSQGHPVLGIEISPIAVSGFFTENRLDANVVRRGPFEAWESDGLRILCGDFFALTPDWLQRVAGVFDRAALIALPPPLRARYAAHLAAILPPSARVLLVTMEYPAGAMDGPPFSVLENEVRSLFEERFLVSNVLHANILDENPRFAERGLKALHEHVYRLDGRR